MASGINVATGTAATDGGTPSQLSSNIMNIYSQEVLFRAQPILRFEAFASRKDELGVAPGLTIKFLKYARLNGDASLTENDDMEKDTITSSLIDITVGEHGKALAVSELLLRSSFTDVMSNSALLLGQHLARYRDGQIRDALLAGSTNARWANNRAGRASLQANDLLDTDMIRECVEVLATGRAPKILGDAYVMFIHPHQARHLRTDPDWISAAHYGAATQVFEGEIGRFEDVRFVETTQIPYITSAGDVMADGVDSGADLTNTSGQNVYRSIMIGDHAVGLAVSLEAELRDNGIKDFGRRHELAWYGIWGTNVIEAGHSIVAETV
jgi:N4-gp56 family major capsid protein